MTVKLHGCTRCGGDLFIDKDEDGWFEQCLLCSHRQDLRVVPRNQVLKKTHIRLETSGIANNHKK